MSQVNFQPYQVTHPEGTESALATRKDSNVRQNNKSGMSVSNFVCRNDDLCGSEDLPERKCVVSEPVCDSDDIDNPFREEERVLSGLSERLAELNKFMAFLRGRPDIFQDEDYKIAEDALADTATQRDTLKASLDARKADYSSTYTQLSHKIQERQDLLESYELKTKVLEKNNLIKPFVDRQVELHKLRDKLKASMVTPLKTK